MSDQINCSKISKSKFIESEKAEYILPYGRENCSSNQISHEDATKCNFSLLMSLIDLQLYCAKFALDEPESFPPDQREHLYNEIQVRSKRLKAELLRRSPQELKTISIALLDYHETIKEGGLFNSYLAEAVYDHYRDMASSIEKNQGNKKIKLDKLLIDKPYYSDCEEIKQNRSKGRLDEYLKLRKNSNSLYRISEGIALILKDIPTLNGEEKILAVQEALRLSGEYIKSSPPTDTPNIDETIMYELQDKGVPVEDLRRFRDMMTHKQLLPLITLDEAEKITECLPALKDILDNKILTSEKMFIDDAINKALMDIEDEELKKAIAEKPELDINPENKSISKLQKTFDQLRESDEYKKLSDAHRVLLEDVYGKIEGMNSKNFNSGRGISSDDKIQVDEKNLSLVREIIKVGKKDAQGNVIERGKESQIKEQLRDIVSEGLKGKISSEVLDLIVNKFFNDATVQKGEGRYFEEKSLKNYFNKKKVTREVIDKVISNIENHYKNKIQDEFHTLKKLNNTHALRSQIIKLYDTLERYSKFKGLNEEAQKVKLARNFLSHGDSLMNFLDDVNTSEKVVQLVKEKIIRDLDIKLFHQVIEESKEGGYAKDLLAKELREKLEEKSNIEKQYNNLKSEKGSLEKKLKTLSGDIDELRKSNQNETHEEMLKREKEIAGKVTKQKDIESNIQTLSGELNNLQEIRSDLERDLQKPKLIELKGSLEKSAISKVVNLRNVEESIESVSNENALKTVLGVVQALICGDNSQLPHLIVKRMAGSSQIASASVHSSTHGECIKWKEINKFNVLVEDSRTPYDLNEIQEDQYYEPREYDNFDSVPINKNYDNIIVDSEKFISHIDNLLEENPKKFHNHVVLASESEVIGKSKDIVGELVNTYRKHSKLERLGRISGHINQGLMAKDFIDDLLAGDYKDAAVNAAFFVSSHGLSMVSNLASMKAVTYISEGKMLFGKSLKLGISFASRGTSAFIAYDLYSQVKEYKKGDKDAIVPIIGDSIQLSSDALSIGVEVGEWAGLSAFEGISAALGPVGETIGLLVFMGGQIYSAVKTVEQIDEKIHLTGMERFGEGLRAFFDMNPENSIKVLMEEKELNNQVVRDIIGFLKSNPQIKRAIFPSMYVEEINEYTSEVVATCSRVAADIFTVGIAQLPCFNRAFYPKRTIHGISSSNEVFLNQKVSNIKWIRAKPDEPAEGRLFCVPNVMNEEKDYIPSIVDTYRSKDAIGVKYSKDREGKSAFINLTEGKNTIVGFPNKNNIFAIGQGYKNIIGGEGDDLFKFTGKSIHNQNPYIKGIIDGQGGTDTLDIAALPSEIKNIVINFQEKNLRDTDNKLSLEVKNINNFIGRVGKIDTVNAACDTRHIDARGGVNDSNYDAVTINDDICNYDAKVIIRPYTKVDSKAKAGVIRYIVNEKEVGTASVNIDANSKCDHQFIFVNYKLDDISSIKIQESTVSFSFSVSNSKFKLLVNGSPTTYSYQLSGSTKLIVGQKNLYALHNTQESINRSSIERYSNIAKKLKMNLVVHSNEEVLSVGHDHHDVIQNDPTAKVSHLVGNGGENIFILKSGVGIKNLPLAGVVLYNFNRKEATRDTLDLREINKQVKELLEDELTFAVNETGKDLKVTLFTQSSKQIIEIRLKDALENHWYKMLDVLINGVLIIEKTDNSFKLSPKPLIFSDRYKTTYVITPNDVERENSIEIKKSIGNYVFARDDNTLVITNALQSSTDEPSTVLLSNFYINDKMKTLNIKFGDKEVVLAKELNRIMELNNKNDFHDRVEQFRTNGYRSVIDSEIKERIVNAIGRSDCKLVTSSIINNPDIAHLRIKDGRAALHLAVLSSNLEIVKCIVNQGTDVNIRDEYGNTSLHLIANSLSIKNSIQFRKPESSHPTNPDDTKKLKIVDYLIKERGARIDLEVKGKKVLDVIKNKGYKEEVNSILEFLKNKLFNAANEKDSSTIRKLLLQGTDPNVKNNYGQNLLHVVSRNNDLSLVRYLIERGSNLSVTDKDGNTPLHCAILNNAMSVAIYLLDEGADLHIENKVQKTPLALLKDKGRLDILSSINRSSNELIVAIREKNINKIKSLFMHIVNVNNKNMYGKTPIHFAVLYGTPEIVRYLADQGANVNIRDKDGYTPLYEATKSNKLDIVNILIEKGAKIDKKVEGKTPMDILKDTGNIHQVRDINIRLEHNLLISLKEGALNKVENLIKQGVNINCKDSDLRTPLHYASKLGFLEIVRLLVYKGADIDKKDKEGFTPLYLAANNGQLDVVNYLIQKGAKITVSNNSNVSDIIKNLTKKLEVELVDAVKKNQLEKIRLLINQGVDVNTRNKDSQTLLHIAVENGYLNLVKLLVEHHADCNLPDKYFHTPLYYAVVSRRLDIVEYLIERGSADINISNNDGKTLLHFATLVGDYSIVEYLMKKNISTTSLVDGITPLHIAALTGDMDTIDFLVKKFNINIRDKDNRTPLHYASKWEKIEVVKYLLENKALVDLKDNNNKTPLDYARENGHSEVERYIVNYRPLNKRLQHNSNKDALNLQVKLDYSLQQVRYNNDEPMSKEELIVENLFSAMRNNDRKWLIEHESNLNIIGKEGETLLHIAALKGYLEVIKYLVSKHADIYAKDNAGKTLMHYAARGGNIEVIKYLIGKDVEIDIKSKEEKTPLQYAASAGYLSAIKYLISQGSDLHAINHDQVTTLHYGAEGNSVEVIEYLLKKGFYINASTHRGKTPIHYAAQKGSLEIIKYLVEHGADVSVRGSFGNTVLHYAAERGDVEIVSYLLKQGIDINTQNHLGNTPLHSASMRGNLDVVSYLRKSGADINIENRNGEKAEDILKKKGLISDKVVSRGKYTNLDELVENLFDSIIRKDNSLFVDKNDILKIQDQSGRTLLHAAASKGYMVVARYLIESAGAEVDSIDSLGRTPLYSAIFNDKLEVVKYLVEECGANISLKDNNQETPLHFAVLNSRVLIVKYLLEQGSQINAKDHDERTPLHLAIYHNKQELAKYLIVKGKANVNVFDINGNTPMHYSSMKGNLNIIQYLVNKGADIYEENNTGKTPLDILREKGYKVAGIIKQFKLNVTMIDAVKHNDIKKVQELIGKGANINIRDKLGQTLINHAVSNNYVNIARYLVNHGADIDPAGGFCPMVSEGNVVSIEPCATNGATSSSLVSKVVSRVKRSISGFFGDSTDMNANVNSSQSIETQNYAAPIKIGRDIPRIDMNNGYGKTVTGNIDVNGNLLLLNVLVRKVTGEKFVPCTSSESISEREAMACAMSITHEFEKALRKAAKASKTKIPQDKLGHQLYINVHSIVTASMVKGEYDKIENILHSAAKYICPEGNKNFVKLINMEIKNMLTPADFKVSTIQKDKPSYGEGQPSSLINQVNAQSINQRRLIA